MRVLRYESPRPAVVSLVALCSLLLGQGSAANSPESLQPNWRSGTVTGVFPPERQKRVDPKSLDHSAVKTPGQSPFPIYTALGANTRWFFVLESQGSTFLASSLSPRGDSFLRKLQPGDAVEVVQRGKKDLYIRINGKTEEKLRLHDLPATAPKNP
jgi:hypothetical protein